MKKCAYCDRADVKISKEHIISKAFINDYYEIGKGYINAEEKYSQNFPTVRDVCIKCNNENLNRLDTYFREFYKKHIPVYVVKELAEVKMDYDFNNLSSWILKTLYNSERKNAYSYLPKKLHRFKEYILGKDNRTKLFKIYTELIQDIDKDEIRKYHPDPNIEVPDKIDYLRIGNSVFSDQLETGVADTFKYIVTSNFVFHVFLVNQGEIGASKTKSLLEKYLKVNNISRVSFLDPIKNSLTLKASNRTIIDMLEKTFEGKKHIVDRMKEEA
jgi:hypothetical protein